MESWNKPIDPCMEYYVTTKKHESGLNELTLKELHMHL